MRYRAFKKADRKMKNRALYLTWILALPMAWIAWQSNAYLLIIDWFELGNEPARIHTLTKGATIGWVWMITVLSLTPIKWYLQKRWEVKPEEYGLEPYPSETEKENEQQ